MSGPRYEADDCREWRARAKSNLRLASVRDKVVYSEELCFNAQQAAEKAIKGVFVKYGREFPYTHTPARLLNLLADAAVVEVPVEVARAADLTRFAFEARYPSVAREVTDEQYSEAFQTADAFVRWAEKIIQEG